MPNATSIGKNAFYGISLTSADLPNATNIGDYAFNDCTSLTAISFSNITSIGLSVFDYCESLKYIVIDNNTIPKSRSSPASGVKVLIPQSMMDAYAADSYWSNYKSQLDAIENYTITRENGQITVQKKITPNITYNGNMNVFLFALSTNDTKAFNITTGSKKDNVSIGHYTNEAFVLTLADEGDRLFERLIVNYKNNFYNLDPNCKYKITTLKIGDTSLSETDISEGDPNIPSITGEYASIDASIDKFWVKSVYKQCTGKELELSYGDSGIPFFEPADPIISTIPVSITFTNVTQ